MFKKKFILLLLPMLCLMLTSQTKNNASSQETRIIVSNPVPIDIEGRISGRMNIGTYACFCNLGGYCAVNGSQSICGFVAGNAPTYWCGAGGGC